MEPLAFTTRSGSTYVVMVRSDGDGIDVVRVSDHPVGAGGRTSFAQRYTSVEFVTGPSGIQAQFRDAGDPRAAFFTSPISEVIRIRA